MEALINNVIGLLNSIFSYFGFDGIESKIILIVLILLIMLSKYLYSFYKQRKLEKNIAPYYSKEDIKKFTRYYVEQHSQTEPPNNEDELYRRYAFIHKGKLIDDFLNKAFKSDDDKFFMVLADTGMGKSAFMINLYMNYIDQWFNNSYKIKLFPLGYGDEIDERIEALEDKHNTILLLDAFDEDQKAVSNYDSRLEQLAELTKEFRKVIITCRTQFFPNQEKEPNNINVKKFGPDKGYYKFLKLYISPLDDNDVKKFLNKKYGIIRFWNFKKKQKANQIIEQAKKLAARPMLLTYMDELVQSNRHYQFKHEVYEELIKRWIIREASPVSNDEEERKTYRKQLYLFSEDVAVYMYRKFKAKNELFIKEDELLAFAQQKNFKISTLEMKSKSLLNRTANGEYKFAHKSILEYFLALEAIRNKEFAKEIDFENNPGMIQGRHFYEEFLLNNQKMDINLN